LQYLLTKKETLSKVNFLSLLSNIFPALTDIFHEFSEFSHLQKTSLIDAKLE